MGKVNKNGSIWLAQAKIKIKTNQEFPGEKTRKIRWGGLIVNFRTYSDAKALPVRLINYLSGPQISKEIVASLTDYAVLDRISGI